jgi:hypothetical protein
MSAPSSVTIADRVVTHLVVNAASESWLPLRAAMDDALTEMLPKYSIEERAELSEAQLYNVGEALRNRLAGAKADGRAEPFDIDGEFVRIRDIQQMPRLQRLANIDPKRFEKLCGQILRGMGSTDIRVTGGPGDGGVDFLALGLPFVPKAVPIPNAIRLVVIGQAKRYALRRNIYLNDLRQFVGAATLHHHRMLLSSELVARQPFIIAYWTTSNFDSGALEYARGLGIWTMNGLTISKYLAELGIDDY